MTTINLPPLRLISEVGRRSLFRAALYGRPASYFGAVTVLRPSQMCKNFSVTDSRTSSSKRTKCERYHSSFVLRIFRVRLS